MPLILNTPEETLLTFNHPAPQKRPPFSGSQALFIFHSNIIHYLLFILPFTNPFNNNRILKNPRTRAMRSFHFV